LDGIWGKSPIGLLDVAKKKPAAGEAAGLVVTVMAAAAVVEG